MKHRTQVFIAIGLLTLILGIAWMGFIRRNQKPEQTFSATINRDCAPWDGSAFTISIPMEGQGVTVSIYQSPELKFPTTFSFPDATLRIGTALLILPLGSPEQLTGKVSFQRVVSDIPVAGEFDLVTNTGELFKGKFIAEWGNEIVLCG